MKAERFELDVLARYHFVKTMRLPDWVTWLVLGVYAVMLLIGVVGPALAEHHFDWLAFGFFTAGAAGTLAVVRGSSALALRRLARDCATVAVDADGYWIGSKFRRWVPVSLAKRKLFSAKIEEVGSIVLLVAEWNGTGDEEKPIVVPFPKEKRALAEACAEHLRSLETQAPKP